jgi:protein-disulfide isomerase
LVDEVLKDYAKDVKFVFKQFPLTTIHPYAMGAAKASLAAHRQGKFWEMHDLLFENARELQSEKLVEYAKQLKLDVKKFEADLNSPDIQRQVDEEMRLAQSADVRGTPTIFVNGKRLMTRTKEGYKAVIDPLLKGG